MTRPSSLALALVVALSGATSASAACAPGKMAGSWTFTAGLFNCVVAIDAAGAFPASPCEGAVMPGDSAVLTAVTPLGDVTLGTLAISSVGKLSGKVATTAACRIGGTLVFETTKGVKTTLTLKGRTDDLTNMFAASAANRKAGTEALLMFGGYRN